jgi:hypothetical protein
MLKRFSIFLGFILGVAGLLAVFGTPIEILTNVPNHYSAISVVLLTGVILALFFGDKLDPEIGSSKKLSRKVTVGRSRTQVNYAEVISEAKSQVTVIGLSLPAFSSETVTEVIRRLADSGVALRIVVANPDGALFSFRRPDVYSNKTDAKSACRNTLSTLSSVWKDLSDVGKFNLEVFVQDMPPTVGILKVDEKILWSPVLLTTTGALSPYLVLAADEPSFGDALVSHINETLVYHTTQLDLDSPLDEQCVKAASRRSVTSETDSEGASK